MKKHETIPIGSLPRALQRRFDGLGSYITSVLEEKGITGLTREDQRVLQLLVFLRVLDDFLQQGHQAAATAVATFGELGVKGFSIGKQVFEPGSEAVMRGRVLSNDLRALTPQHLLTVLDSAPTLHDLVGRLARLLRREEHYDQ